MSKTNEVGRPRNPAIDVKVLRAALDLYGEHGWYGFTLTDVAKRAEVGKSALYSRWADKSSLLAAAFSAHVANQGPVGQTPEEVLYHEAHHRLFQFLGRNATAIHRLLLEARTYHDPEIYSVYESIFVRPAQLIKDKLWEFKNSGELPKEMSVSRLLDSLRGSVLTRSIFVAASQKTCFISGCEDYLTALVKDHLGATANDRLAEILMASGSSLRASEGSMP